MTKLIDLVNAPSGKRILMEMFEGDKKVAEEDISDMTPRKLKKAIALQEMQGRTWSYRTIIFNDGG